MTEIPDEAVDLAYEHVYTPADGWAGRELRRAVRDALTAAYPVLAATALDHLAEVWEANAARLEAELPNIKKAAEHHECRRVAGIYRQDAIEIRAVGQQYRDAAEQSGNRHTSAPEHKGPQ